MNINQPQGASPVPQYQMPYDLKPKIRKTTSFTHYDCVFSVIFLITAILSFNFSCFGGFNLGFAISGVVLSAYAVVYNMPKGFSLTGTFFALCGAVISATCFIFDEAFKGLAVFLFWVFWGLSLYFCSKCGKAKSEKGVVAEILEFMVLAPFMHLPLLFNSISDAAKEKNSAKRFMPVLIGIACAIPALVIIVPLLIEGDAAFEGLINTSVFANFGEILCSAIFGTLAAVLGFSVIFAAKNDLCFKEKPASAQKGLPLLAVNGFFGALSSVYVLYLFSQIDYFLGGLMGFLPTEFKVADYARRGFFEMSVICVLNLLFMLFAYNFSKRQKGKGLTVLKSFLTFICAFSMFLISSVVAKLVLYMKSFAITRLRVLTTVFCVILAAAFVCVIIKLFAPKFRFVRTAAVITSVIILVVSCTGIDGFIAKYNYNAYISGNVQDIDVTYLSRLGKSSVVYLVNLLDCPDKDVAAYASCALIAQYYDYGENESAADAAAYVYGYMASFEMPPEEETQYDGILDSVEVEVLPEISTKDNPYPKVSGELKPHKKPDFRGFNITRNHAGEVYKNNWDKIVQRYNTLVANTKAE